MVLPVSRRVPRVPRYSGTGRGSLTPFAYGAFTLYRRSFQIVRLGDRFFTPRRHCSGAQPGPTTPSLQRLQTWHNDGLGCSLFARRYWGNRVCFLFLRVLRWFTSPGWLRHPIEFRWRSRGLPSRGCPIRRSSGQRLFAAHRSLSQLTTSFIAGLRQGIHRTPLVA
jgi:hypothetical protein